MSLEPRNINENSLSQNDRSRVDTDWYRTKPFQVENNPSCSAALERRPSWLEAERVQITVKEEPLLEEEPLKREEMEESDPSTQHIFVRPNQQRSDSSWATNEETSIKPEPLSDVEEEDSAASERNTETLATGAASQEASVSWLQTEGEPSNQSSKILTIESRYPDVVEKEFYRTMEAQSCFYSKSCFANEEKFTCNECGDVFETLDDVSVHKEIHGENIGIDIKCNETPALRGALVSDSSHDERVNMCRNATVKNEVWEDAEPDKSPSICRESFSKVSYLKAHESSPSSGKCHKCPDCDKSFTRASNLRVHMRSHAGVKPYTCDECGKSFTRAANLTRHQYAHAGVKQYICDECGNLFTEAGSLRMHKRIHAGVKPYICKYCSKSFTNSGQVTQHERTHTGAKPYTCKHCSKSFSQSSNLKKHERIHTGLKPYTCKHCSKSFSNSSQLNRHKRTHTGVKPYTCKHCNMSFTQSSSQKMHERAHISVTLYICKHCGKSFKHSSSLRKHEKTHPSSSGDSSKKDIIYHVPSLLG